MLHGRVFVILAITTWFVVDAAPASAQAEPAAPAGLFAGDGSSADSRHSLDLLASLVGAYDSDVLPENRTAVRQLFGPEAIGRSGQLLTDTRYRWAGRNVQLRANTTSASRYDLQTRYSRDIGYTGALGLTVELPRRTTLVVNQTGSHSPAYLYNLFPLLPAASLTERVGVAPSAAPDYSVGNTESTTIRTEITATHAITRRSIFTVIVDGDLTNYRPTATERLNQRTLGTTGRLARQMTRSMTGVARYVYREGDLPSAAGPIAGVSTQHNAEIGFVYDRPVSRTRRLGLDVNAGATVLTPPPPPRGTGRRYPSRRLVGQVGARYQFGQTWQTSGTYRRGVDFVPGVLEPVSTDGFTARIEGLLSYRLDALVMASYVTGVPMLSQGQGFDTYTGTARLRFALTKTMAVYSEYLHYVYDFRGYPLLMPSAPPILERSGVRVGLTLFVPALGR